MQQDLQDGSEYQNEYEASSLRDKLKLKRLTRLTLLTKWGAVQKLGDLLLDHLI